MTLLYRSSDRYSYAQDKFLKLVKQQPFLDNILIHKDWKLSTGLVDNLFLDESRFFCHLNTLSSRLGISEWYLLFTDDNCCPCKELPIFRISLNDTDQALHQIWSTPVVLYGDQEVYLGHNNDSIFIVNDLGNAIIHIDTDIDRVFVLAEDSILSILSQLLDDYYSADELRIQAENFKINGFQKLYENYVHYR